VTLTAFVYACPASTTAVGGIVSANMVKIIWSIPRVYTSILFIQAIVSFCSNKNSGL
jgi:DNA transposition AAA+ family ATPase